MPETQLFTPYWGLSSNYIDLQTRYYGEEIVHFHLVAERQVSALIRIFGPGVSKQAVGAQAAEDALKVTDMGAGVIKIAPGAGTLIDAVHGPVCFDLAAPVYLTPSGASPKYIYPVYVVAPDGTTEDTHQTGLVTFVASDTAPPDGTNSLATVPFSGSVIGAITDTRVFLNAGADRRALLNTDEYDAATAYDANNLVQVDGVFYLSRVDSNLNHSPATSPTQWVSLGAQIIVVASEDDLPDPPIPNTFVLVGPIDTEDGPTFRVVEATSDYAADGDEDRINMYSLSPHTVTLPTPVEAMKGEHRITLPNIGEVGTHADWSIVIEGSADFSNGQSTITVPPGQSLETYVDERDAVLYWIKI